MSKSNWILPLHAFYLSPSLQQSTKFCTTPSFVSFTIFFDFPVLDRRYSHSIVFMLRCNSTAFHVIGITGNTMSKLTTAPSLFFFCSINWHLAKQQKPMWIDGGQILWICDVSYRRWSSRSKTTTKKGAKWPCVSLKKKKITNKGTTVGGKKTLVRKSL